MLLKCGIISNMIENENTMEDLYCIGCGAKIQTEDKNALGFLPAGALKKKIALSKLRIYTVSVVSACVIIMRLHRQV